jgi:RNA recognition motif-containing protein
MIEEQDLRSPTVRVEGLPPSLTDGDFEKWMTSLGIRFAQSMIVRRITGEARGFAFIVTDTHEQAEAAAERINTSTLRNRTLSATVGQDRPARHERVA